MKQLRAKTEKSNKEKFKKHKEKRKSEQSSNTNDSCHNSQNVSYNNSQNVSYNNSQNVSKIYLKGFKSTPEGFKSTFNLSISEDIEKAELPIKLKQTLINKIDRLIEFDIQISDIDLHFNANKDTHKEANIILSWTIFFQRWNFPQIALLLLWIIDFNVIKKAK